MTVHSTRWTWRDLVAVHRLQGPMPVAYLCYAVAGACFAVDHAAQLVTVAVVAASVANLLLMLAGLGLNAVVDVDTDAAHDDKNYLAQAVLRLSRRRVAWWVGAEAVLGLALAAVAALLSGHGAVAGAAAAVVACQLLYNVEPVRLKRRGFVGAVVFGVAAAPLEWLLGYTTVRPDLPVNAVLIFAGLCLLHVGRTVWWSVPDAAADRAARVGTPSARHGVTAATARSCVLMLAGIIVLAAGLGRAFGPAWAAGGVLLHVVVLVFAAAPLLTRSRAMPTSRWLRTRAIVIVTVAEVVFLAIPLTHL